jgi:hypothetical protein
LWKLCGILVRKAAGGEVMDLGLGEFLQRLVASRGECMGHEGHPLFWRAGIVRDLRGLAHGFRQERVGVEGEVGGGDAEGAEGLSASEELLEAELQLLSGFEGALAGELQHEGVGFACRKRAANPV